MESFLQTHSTQHEALNLPESLLAPLFQQLQTLFPSDDGTMIDHEQQLLRHTSSKHLAATIQNTEYGALFVIPHILRWDIRDHKGMYEELQKLSDSALRLLFGALSEQVWKQETTTIRDITQQTDRVSLIESILQPATWSRVILYRSHDQRVMAALPAPPYFAQQADPSQEPDLTGPFPYQYHLQDGSVIDMSLVYISPDVSNESKPTLDLVPSFTCPTPLARYVRYAALLSETNMSIKEAVVAVKLVHAEFTRKYHLRRQEVLEHEPDNQRKLPTDELPASDCLKVYTDTNDPMELAHAEAGLDPSKYELIGNFQQADIIFSYQSVFAAQSVIQQFLQTTPRTVFINQFPYEGAFVQKDHLARELLNQHGLPRPSWAMETYDLDVQLDVFVGAALLAQERQEDPIWIVKPASGTQSKGILITKSVAHILKLVDAGIHSWVVQRYIKQPVCYQGRKLDCRCIVMLRDAEYKPQIYMHKRVYFRIANKVHSIDSVFDLLDQESVLTANHLLSDEHRSSGNPLQTLPVDFKTIAVLEEQYACFDWEGDVLPKIQTMVRELFNGMTRGFPGMAQGKHRSRAAYGLDMMFEIQEDESIEVKLTEVTFCPANNAICDAYERDDEVYRTYNTDVFDCLFRGVCSERIVELH